MLSNLKRFTFPLFIVLFIASPAFAQGPFTLRKFLNYIHMNLSVGGGMTSYKSKIEDLKVLNKDGHFYFINKDDEVYQANWFSDTYTQIIGFEVQDDDNITNLDQLIVFKGKGINIPIAISFYSDIKKRLRLGVGMQLDINMIQTFHPHAPILGDSTISFLGDYHLAKKTSYYFKPFGMVGFKVIDTPTYSLLADTHIGFALSYPTMILLKKKYYEATPFYNLGITLEKHISEYFRLIGRVSYELKMFIDNFEKTPFEEIIFHERPALFAKVGISFNVPEIPKCRIKDCDIEIKHRHGGKAFRGLSMFKGKDAKGNLLHAKQR